ncbi:hypothetical protein GKODMF_13265 [Candidatus Electrothrix gigas]
MQIYQDIWVNGAVQTKGIRDCAGRYNHILTHCKKYNRPFTVLDIGANLGYFSFRLTSDFDCVAVMVEGSPGYQKMLKNLIQQQEKKDDLILLGTTLNYELIKELSSCEHFDVVLGLRVVHHFQEPFRDVIEGILSLGDHVFLELPTAGEDEVRAKKRIQDELDDHASLLKNYNYKKVGEFPIHVGATKSPMYLIEKTEKVLLRPFLNSRRQVRHTIQSTFGQKKIYKNDSSMERGQLISEWVPGINLYSYHLLNGLYPDRQSIYQMIKDYKLPFESPLTDIRPWNFILSGSRLTLIDHTSKNNSLGRSFRDNPKTCLINTALHLYANRGDLTHEVFNRHFFATGLYLFFISLVRTARETSIIFHDKIRIIYKKIKKDYFHN